MRDLTFLLKVVFGAMLVLALAKVLEDLVLPRLPPVETVKKAAPARLASPPPAQAAIFTPEPLKAAVPPAPQAQEPVPPPQAEAGPAEASAPQAPNATYQTEVQTAALSTPPSAPTTFQTEVKEAALTPPPPVEPASPPPVRPASPLVQPATIAPAPLAIIKLAIIKKAAAKELFGAAKEPANLAARSIGFYAKGCLAGARALPVNGPAWQVMRLSRNRNWGHPSLIAYIERFAKDAKEKDGWPGLLVGDLSMPRGGPMPFGHASHQVGLDVDIWYRPEPDHEFSAKEREDIPMESFLSDPGHVNTEMWKPEFEKLLRRAVSYPEVARIFVNPAIKKWLCDNVKSDRGFLHKVTPIYGHHDHFHVRLVCPANDPGCRNQPPNAADEGCGKGLEKWIAALSKPVASLPPVPASPKPPAKAAKQKPPLTLKDLPNECEIVLKAESRPRPAVSALQQN
jgi:penicillin-insensitive murein DD-endopeptidase